MPDVINPDARRAETPLPEFGRTIRIDLADVNCTITDFSGRVG